MLFVLWNVAHCSIIAVAFIRNGFILFIILSLYILTTRARALRIWRVRATASGSAGVRSVRAGPPNGLRGITATGQKYFYIIKRLHFIAFC